MQKRLLFILSAFLAVQCMAQQYPFVYYTPNDGLVNSRVRNIKQDSKGRMYFMTYAGLSVYDGSRFINYRVQDGLANDLINDVCEAGADSMLVATNTQKLNVLVNGAIHTLNTVDNFCPIINRFLKSSDGKLYATADDGLYMLLDKKFIRLPFSYNKVNDPGLFFDQIIEWKNFFVLVPWKSQQGKDLFLYNKTTQEISDILYDNSGSSIATNSLGQILVSNSTGTQLLDTLSLQNGKIVFAVMPLKWNALKEVKNAALFFDSENDLWLFNNDFIKKISSGGESETINTANNKLSNLTNLFEDRENIIWMATDGNGVIKLKEKNLQLIDEINNAPLKAYSMSAEGDTLWLLNSHDNTLCRISNNFIQSNVLGIKLHSSGNIYLLGKKIYITDGGNIIAINDKQNPVHSFIQKLLSLISPPLVTGLEWWINITLLFSLKTTMTVFTT